MPLLCQIFLSRRPCGGLLDLQAWCISCLFRQSFCVCSRTQQKIISDRKVWKPPPAFQPKLQSKRLPLHSRPGCSASETEKPEPSEPEWESIRTRFAMKLVYASSQLGDLMFAVHVSSPCSQADASGQRLSRNHLPVPRTIK